MSNAGRWAPWYTDDSTPQPYGDQTTYRIAEQHLGGLDVEDWGCGYAWFKRHHRGGYTGIDGTPGYADVVADLVDYRSETPGLLLRHVLEHNHDWEQILANAAASATQVLVVVVFTPKADTCDQVGWTPGLEVPDLTIPHKALTAVCPEWVTTYADRLSRHDGIDLHAQEIRQSHYVLRTLADLVERRWIVGTCTQVNDDGTECAGVLEVRTHHTAGWTPDRDWDTRRTLTLRCRRCGDTWTEADVLGLLNVQDVWLHTDLVADLLGVTPRAIRAHVERGRIRRSTRGIVSWSDAKAAVKRHATHARLLGA